MSKPSKPAHILVVDDEAPIRTSAPGVLRARGVKVSEAATGAEMRSQLAAGSVDLITLDLKLGGENGLEIAREIRAQSNVPVIMVTGKGDTIDRVVGLKLGADDYIAKPFHVRKVQARVRAAMRQRTYRPQAALI